MDIINVNEQKCELIGFASDIRDIVELEKNEYYRDYKLPPIELIRHDVVKQAIRWRENEITKGGITSYKNYYLKEITKFINSIHGFSSKLILNETDNYPKHWIIYHKEFLNGAWVLRVIE